MCIITVGTQKSCDSSAPGPVPSAHVSDDERAPSTEQDMEVSLPAFIEDPFSPDSDDEYGGLSSVTVDDVARTIFAHARAHGISVEAMPTLVSEWSRSLSLAAFVRDISTDAKELTPAPSATLASKPEEDVPEDFASFLIASLGASDFFGGLMGRERKEVLKKTTTAQTW
jgi:hypothetical protein